MLNPRESGVFIAQHSRNVAINDDCVRVLGKTIFDLIKVGSINNDKAWVENFMLLKTEKETANWCFFINVVNFSFWTNESEKFVVTQDNVKHTGYFACCALIKRAIEELNLPMLDCSFYDSLTPQLLAEILTGDMGVVMPLVEERFKCLKGAASTLQRKFDGSFINCLRLCNNNAQNLVRILLDEFESFRDFATYNGKKVCFLKRAQILASDIFQNFRGKELANFSDIDSLTMFADYRIPQVLAYAKVLQYSARLMEILKSREIIPNGNDLEIEIRGCSIEAIERIVKEVKRLLAENNGPNSNFRVNSAVVDYYLWNYRRSNAIEVETVVPFHLTRCIYY